jgi:hypothetical protein
MSHWVNQIRQYGALQQYSGMRHDQEYKTNLIDGWTTSNLILNDLPQEFTFQRRILSLKVRDLNLQVLAQDQEHSTATCKVLSSGADLAAPLSPQSYTNPVFR